jgi:hypothetical protein
LIEELRGRGERIEVVDGTGTPEQVTEAIAQAVIRSTGISRESRAKL